MLCCSLHRFSLILRYCGSCYIHGALHAANDRIKLLLNGMHDLMLARQVCRAHRMADVHSLQSLCSADTDSQLCRSCASPACCSS